MPYRRVEKLIWIEYILADIDLGEGLSTILDKESYLKIKSVMKVGSSFRRIKSRDRYYCEFTDTNSKKHLVHRYLIGEDSYLVDHLNGDSLDNRLCNLRKFNYKLNSIDRHKIHSHNNSTGLCHISRIAKLNKFRVQITKNRIQHIRGLFDTIEQAIECHKLLLPKLYPNNYEHIFKLNGYNKS